MGNMNKRVLWFSYPVFDAKAVHPDKFMDEAHKFLNRVAALGFGYLISDVSFGKTRFYKGIIMFEGGEYSGLNKRSPPDSWQRFFRFRPFHHGWFGPDVQEGTVVELLNYTGPTSMSTPQKFFEHNNFFQAFAYNTDDIVIFAGFDAVPRKPLEGVEIVTNPRLQTWRREPKDTLVKKLPRGKTQRLFSWKKSGDYDHKKWPSMIKRAMGIKKNDETK